MQSSLTYMCEQSGLGHSVSDLGRAEWSLSLVI